MGTRGGYTESAYNGEVTCTRRGAATEYGDTLVVGGAKIGARITMATMPEKRGASWAFLATLATTFARLEAHSRPLWDWRFDLIKKAC